MSCEVGNTGVEDLCTTSLAPSFIFFALIYMQQSAACMKTASSAACLSSNELPEDQRYNPRKMFVGGLGPHITARSLIEYFSKYGEVSDSSIVLDRATGRSRGFGFVIFKDIQSVDKCGQKLRHIIDNVNCEVRKAVPREDARQQSEMGARCKVFVSGLSEATRENHLREYFEAFGTVEEANIKTDRVTGRSRGFAFVLFKTPEAARQSLGPHPELGPTVEAKIAEPRTSASGGGGSSGSNGGFSGNGNTLKPIAPMPTSTTANAPPQLRVAVASSTAPNAPQWPPYNAYAPYSHLADMEGTPHTTGTLSSSTNTSLPSNYPPLDREKIVGVQTNSHHARNLHSHSPAHNFISIEQGTSAATTTASVSGSNGHPSGSSNFSAPSLQPDEIRPWFEPSLRPPQTSRYRDEEPTSTGSAYRLEYKPSVLNDYEGIPAYQPDWSTSSVNGWTGHPNMPKTLPVEHSCGAGGSWFDEKGYSAQRHGRIRPQKFSPY